MQWSNKLTGETVDYSLDWTERLATAETLVTSTWAVEDSSLTLSGDSFDGNITSVFLAAGVAGNSYSILNTITTSASRTMQQVVTILIEVDPIVSVMIVEDGTGKIDANSYVSLADANLYHAARGNSGWVGGQGAKEVALIRATQAIDAKGLRRFVGDKATSTQALAWPRTDATDAYGFDIAETALPPALIKSICEAALIEIMNQGALEPTLERGGMVTRERVEGAIDISYANGAPQGTTYSVVTNALSPLLRSGGIQVERV